MTYKALCNSCLRVVTFKTEQGFAAAQTNEVQCICSGDLCGCSGCADVARDLERGNLAPGGLKVRMESWTADGGAVGVTERNLQLETYATALGTFAPLVSILSRAALAQQVAQTPTPIREYQQAAIDSFGARYRKHGEGLVCDMEQPPSGGKTVVIEDIARSLGIKNVYVAKRPEPLNAAVGHLSLTRRPDESVRVGDDVLVTVLRCNGRTCDIAYGVDGGAGRVIYGADVGLSFYVTPRVLVRVADIKGSQVRLHFEADRSISIVRTELL